MKAKIITITLIATIDAFFVGFAIGFNSKHAVVENPSLPPVSSKKMDMKESQKH